MTSSGETELKAVLQVFVKETKELVYIGTSEHRDIIESTTNHPFYVIDMGWVPAGDLRVGDTVYQAGRNLWFLLAYAT